MGFAALSLIVPFRPHYDTHEQAILQNGNVPFWTVAFIAANGSVCVCVCLKVLYVTHCVGEDFFRPRKRFTLSS